MVRVSRYLAALPTLHVHIKMAVGGACENLYARTIMHIPMGHPLVVQ